MKVKLLHELAKVPTRGSEHSAGWDLYADESATINPGEGAVIDTGIALEIPKGFYGDVRPRSGLALRYGLDVLAGVIDSDYRGEIMVILINHGDAICFISEGDKMAQLIIQPYDTSGLTVVDDLDTTKRGAGGFGSTGK